MMIDIEKAGGIEAGRLERCLGLVAERIGPGQYRVAGGSEPHWVDLRSRLVPRCDCGDHLWRERVCKHILAALLREGDARVIHEIGTLVRGLRERLKPHRFPRGAPGAGARVAAARARSTSNMLRGAGHG